jgi:hypothetical protein
VQQACTGMHTPTHARPQCPNAPMPHQVCNHPALLEGQAERWPLTFAAASNAAELAEAAAAADAAQAGAAVAAVTGQRVRPVGAP